ncbi:MAG: DUF4229 domain-containing protein [Pseudonocardia sp.]|nr:DUF4229 domain-containing protein [Pseudonocardia sp.]
MDENDGAPGLATTFALYAVARLGLVAIVAGILTVAGVPLIIAVLAGILVALPLSMVVFRGLRRRLDSALAATVVRRRAERSALRARLRGEEASDVTPVGSDPAGDGQPDRGTD